ncbi:MAG: aminotransferase class I/II-fold pyridoxal phosphate-dependent enzyme [Ktedonobacteraceae bacterium]
MSTMHPQRRLSSQKMSQMQAEGPLGLTMVASAVTTSPTLAINEAVAKQRAEGQEIIHLGFGEASFPLHPLLQTALSEAAKHTAYAPVLGIAELRKAIADYLTRTRQLACLPEQIAVGPGSKPLLYALLQVLEGDLLLPVPSWVSYAPQAKLAGRNVIGVETDSADCHRITPQKLTMALDCARNSGANPRILLVNTPSNPTGSMFTYDDAEAIALWAREKGITLISDEIYAELAHGWREHISPACFYPEGTIITGGLSKAFSAGGWRLGYAMMPPTEQGLHVITALRSLGSEIWSSASTPIQKAAVVAFSPNTELEDYVRRSARIHGYVASWLYEVFVGLDIPCPRPAGAFYLYPDFSPWRQALLKQGVTTSEELALYLLNKWNIATLPGSAFGEKPEVLHLRLSTSMLYTPDGVAGDERKAILWDLLAHAEQLPSQYQADGPQLTLPALDRVQKRFTEVITFLTSIQI